ncbi:hypothetical protein DFH06DRAFT_1125904 [Mycena polygramma]|nr:hypothetical protein DFH06DRAFT_1125904 [Mycena polygramma]
MLEVWLDGDQHSRFHSKIFGNGCKCRVPFSAVPERGWRRISPELKENDVGVDAEMPESNGVEVEKMDIAVKTTILAPSSLGTSMVELKTNIDHLAAGDRRLTRGPGSFRQRPRRRVAPPRDSARRDVRVVTRGGFRQPAMRQMLLSANLKTRRSRVNSVLSASTAPCHILIRMCTREGAGNQHRMRFFFPAGRQTTPTPAMQRSHVPSARGCSSCRGADVAKTTYRRPASGVSAQANPHLRPQCTVANASIRLAACLSGRGGAAQRRRHRRDHILASRDRCSNADILPPAGKVPPRTAMQRVPHVDVVGLAREHRAAAPTSLQDGAWSGLGCRFGLPGTYVKPRNRNSIFGLPASGASLAGFNWGAVRNILAKKSACGAKVSLRSPFFRPQALWLARSDFEKAVWSAEPSAIPASLHHVHFKNLLLRSIPLDPEPKLQI